jgi:hypothetical protein
MKNLYRNFVFSFSLIFLFYFRMLELRVQYLDDNATDGSGELSTPAGELIGRSPPFT